MLANHRSRTAIIKGTVNDAVSYPEPSKSHGSYHWAFERLISASLIPLTIGAAVTSPTAHVSLIGVRERRKKAEGRGEEGGDVDEKEEEGRSC